MFQKRVASLSINPSFSGGHFYKMAFETQFFKESTKSDRDLIEYPAAMILIRVDAYRNSPR
jgi:hypothetical protein